MWQQMYKHQHFIQDYEMWIPVNPTSHKYKICPDCGFINCGVRYKPSQYKKCYGLPQNSEIWAVRIRFFTCNPRSPDQSSRTQEQIYSDILWKTCKYFLC